MFRDKQGENVMPLPEDNKECCQLDSFRTGKYIVLPYVDLDSLHKTVPMKVILGGKVADGETYRSQIDTIRKKCLSIVSKLTPEKMEKLVNKNPIWDKQMFDGHTGDMAYLQTFRINKIRMKVFIRNTLGVVSLFISAVDDVIIPSIENLINKPKTVKVINKDEVIRDSRSNPIPLLLN